MLRSLRRLTLVGWGLALACTPPATTVQPPSEPSKVSTAPDWGPRLDRLLTAYGSEWGEAYRFSGFVSVRLGGEVVYARGMGKADRELGRVHGPDTMYAIGSLTKQFTAAAILRLQQAGRLHVDDPISEYLPDYPAHGNTITIHQLLNHSAGLPDYLENQDFLTKSSRSAQTPEQLLNLFKDQPLIFEPGKGHQYSNSSYVILGMIIEAITGQRYQDFVATELFEPAGLTRTRMDPPTDDDRAQGYRSDPRERIVPAPPIHPSAAYAAGGLFSTARDLERWDDALRTGELLTPDSLAALYRAGEANYGYGWYVSEHQNHQLVEHSGGVPGFVSHFIRVPELALSVVVFANIESASVENIARGALQLATGGEIDIPQERPAYPVKAALQNRLVGHYHLDPSTRTTLTNNGWLPIFIEKLARVVIRSEAGDLLIKPSGQDEVMVFSSNDGTLFAKNIFELHPKEIEGEAFTLRLMGLDDILRYQKD